MKKYCFLISFLLCSIASFAQKQLQSQTIIAPRDSIMAVVLEGGYTKRLRLDSIKAYAQRGLISVYYTNGTPSNAIDASVKFAVDTTNNPPKIYTRKNGAFVEYYSGIQPVDTVNRQKVMTRKSTDSLITVFSSGYNTEQTTTFPMRNFESKFITALAGTASTAKIAHIGDSNTAGGGMDNIIRSIFKDVLLPKGYGFVSCSSFDVVPTGLTRTNVGFVNKSITDNPISGIDMSWAQSAASGNTITMNYQSTIVEENYMTNIVIFASGTGSFTYSLNGGGAVTVPLNPTITAHSISVTEGRYNLVITAGAASQNFYGVHFYSTAASVNYMKLAQSGRKFSDFATIDQTALNVQMTAIDPDLIIWQLGSNDLSVGGATAASVMTNVRASVSKILVSKPTVDMMFVIPSDRNVVAGITLEKEFADSLENYCIKNRYNYINLYKTYGYQPEAQALGFFNDEVHFATKGHTLNANLIMTRILQNTNRNIWKKTGNNSLYYTGSKVQVGRGNSALGGYLDIYAPTTTDPIATLQGGSNTQMQMLSTANSVTLQAIDGSFNRISSTQEFRIYDGVGLKYNSTNNAFTGKGSFTGALGIGTSVNTSLHMLDVDAINGFSGNPVRFQGLQAGASSDSIVTSNTGVLKRNTLSTYFNAGINSNVVLNTIGNKLSIKEGSNASMGTATLVAGAVTVSNTLVTASSRIFVTVQTAGGTQGFLSVTRSAGTSFTITSTSASDTSTVSWIIIEPN